MIISYFGLTCFRIQNNDLSLLIDPYDKKETGLDLPRMQNDIVISTKKEGAASGGEKTFFISGPGEYEIKDVFIYGLSASGDEDNGMIYLIQSEGITILHLGTIKQFKLSDEQKELVENTDILMVPVGGGESLTPKQAAEIINELEPRLVVPMYYSQPNLKLKLGTVDVFKKELGAKCENVDKLKIHKKDLQTEETKVVIIEPAA